MNLSFYRKHFNLINDDIPNDKNSYEMGLVVVLHYLMVVLLNLYHILRRIKVIN
jgi:hypothetical protein